MCPGLTHKNVVEELAANPVADNTPVAILAEVATPAMLCREAEPLRLCTCVHVTHCARAAGVASLGRCSREYSARGSAALSLPPASLSGLLTMDAPSRARTFRWPSGTRAWTAKTSYLLTRASVMPPTVPLYARSAPLTRPSIVFAPPWHASASYQ